MDFDDNLICYRSKMILRGATVTNIDNIGRCQRYFDLLYRRFLKLGRYTLLKWKLALDIMSFDFKKFSFFVKVAKNRFFINFILSQYG